MHQLVGQRMGKKINYCGGIAAALQQFHCLLGDIIADQFGIAAHGPDSGRCVAYFLRQSKPLDFRLDDLLSLACGLLARAQVLPDHILQIIYRVKIDVLQLGHVGIDVSRHSQVSDKNRFLPAFFQRLFYLCLVHQRFRARGGGDDHIGVGQVVGNFIQTDSKPFEFLRQRPRLGDAAVGDDHPADAAPLQVACGQFNRFASADQKRAMFVERGKDLARQTDRCIGHGDRAGADLSVGAHGLGDRERLLKQWMQNRSRSAGIARYLIGILHLPEDLRFPEDCRVEPAGDAEGVADRPVPVECVQAVVQRPRNLAVIHQPVTDHYIAARVAFAIKLGPVAGGNDDYFLNNRQPNQLAQRPIQLIAAERDLLPDVDGSGAVVNSQNLQGHILLDGWLQSLNNCPGTESYRQDASPYRSATMRYSAVPPSFPARMKKYLLFLIGVGLLASACAQTGQRPDAGAEDPQDVQKHVLMAELAVQQHDFAAAAREYAQVMRTTDDPILAARAAPYVFDYGEYDDAVMAASRWIKLDPDALEPRRQIAALYLQKGEVGKALPQLEWLFGVVTAQGDQGFVALLPLLSESGNEAAGYQAIKRLTKQHQEDATAHYALAFMALSNGDLEVALASSERALSLRPDWAEAAVLRARVLIVDGRTEEAMESLQDWPGFRENARLRLEFAILQLAVDRVEEARLELELLLADFPRMPAALRTLGLLEFQAGNYQLAERYLIELIGTGQYMADAMFYLGSIAEIENDLDGAASFYARVTGGSNAAAARVRLALILYRLGDPEKALRSLELFPATDMESTLQLVNARGELLMRMERYDEALALYDAELQRYPDEQSLRYSRAFLLDRMGRIDDALAVLQQLLQENPQDPIALNALGYTLADRTDRYQEAYGYISQALEYSPDSPAIIDSMGWVQFKMGNLETAETYLRQAWSLDSDPEIAAHLGEVLWTMGDTEAAEEVWFEALSQNPDSIILQKVIERLRQ